MALDPDLVDAVRDLDEHELRRLVMLARARLERHGVPVDAGDRNVSFRSQAVRCGKSSCTRCPHGPYWYAYWYEEGRRRSLYLGRLAEDEVPGLPSASDAAGYPAQDE